MKRIRALNEPSSSSESYDDEDDSQKIITREAHQEKLLEQYKQALHEIQESNEEEARSYLKDLIEQLEDVEEHEEVLVRLKYSVLKNLGAISEDGLKYYLEALEIDNGDVNLWIKAGDLAFKNGNFIFARYCFQQAQSMSPNNWIIIDRLLDCFYLLHSPFELYDLCMKALDMNPHYHKARVLSNNARNMNPCVDRSPICTQSIDPDDKCLLRLKALKSKHREQRGCDIAKNKRLRMSINLDLNRVQSLASFGQYLLRTYERYSKQGVTKATAVEIIFGQSLNYGQSVVAPAAGVSNAETTDSLSDSSKSEANQASEEVTSETVVNTATKSGKQSKNTSFIFPVEFCDKRRSSRNRPSAGHSKSDENSERIKFNELNELLPAHLRVSAIEDHSNDKIEQVSEFETQLTDTTREAEKEDKIIKEIIESICLASSEPDRSKSIRFNHILRLYLSKLATKKHNILPDVFLRLYKVYRSINSLPADLFIDNTNFSVDDAWICLVAGELDYNHRECNLLLRLLDQITLTMPCDEQLEFTVRLLVLSGKHNCSKHLGIALEHLEDEMRIYATNKTVITRAYIRSLIERIKEDEAENDDSNNDIGFMEAMANKTETEMSDKEVINLCSSIVNSRMWQRGVDILNQRNDMSPEVILQTINTCQRNGAKIDARMATKLCKEALNGASPTAWTCLYRASSSQPIPDEARDPAQDKQMDKFFALGHQILGKRGTCTADKGEFLTLYAAHLLVERDDYDDREAINCFTCLFGYPYRRSGPSTLHKSPRVTLTWEHAELIYEYFAPDELPTYLSLLRKVGITSELELMFRELVNVVPEALDPRPLVDCVNNYIEHGITLECAQCESHPVTGNIYYFMADYYFKNQAFERAKQFYAYDLTLNPNRFDSWAASALIRANEIDRLLVDGSIECDSIIDGSVCRLANAAIRCFEKAVEIKPNDDKATLWIEYGNLTYNLSSLIMRSHSLADFDATLNQTPMPNVRALQLMHKRMTSIAHKCFESANKYCSSQEVWLHFYMLGKIAEKVDTFKALDYYAKADVHLYLEGASYPSKIPYHNPPDLAYEAMELHYRIHSSALKFLLSSPEPSDQQLKLIQRHLIQAHRSPFVEQRSRASSGASGSSSSSNPRQSLQNTNELSYQSTSQQQQHNHHHHQQHQDLSQRGINNNMRSIVDILVNDLLDSVCDQANFDQLIFMCLNGLKRCLTRYDRNFKALYRLSHYYNKIEDPAMARSILMGGEIPIDARVGKRGDYYERAQYIYNEEFMWRNAPPDLRGVDSLFGSRKQGNFFNNVWRIPIEEVDRPGSFEYWMFKCTHLLIVVCTKLSDYQMLSSIAFYLSKTPETNKKYLHHRERLLLAQFAAVMLTTIDGNNVRNMIRS